MRRKRQQRLRLKNLKSQIRLKRRAAKTERQVYGVEKGEQVQGCGAQKKRRLSQGTTEELFDLLSRQLKDTHSGQKWLPWQCACTSAWDVVSAQSSTDWNCSMTFSAVPRRMLDLKWKKRLKFFQPNLQVQIYEVFTMLANISLKRIYYLSENIQLYILWLLTFSQKQYLIAL